MSAASERPGVERREIAPGLEISRVVTGLWQVADMERDGAPLDPEAAAEALLPRVEAGMTSFDMADHYGSAEVVAGRLGRKRPSGVERLTKWVPQPGPVSRADAEEAIDRACRRLETDTLDLLQFHAWNYWDPSYLDALDHLCRLREAGRIRHLGMTNCDTAHLALLLESGYPMVSNQVSFSLLDRRAAGRMSELARERGVSLLAYGTLAGGFLTDRWLDREEPTELDTWSQQKYRRFIEEAGGWEGLQRVLKAAATVGRRHGVSIADVAMRAILDETAVGGILVGARPGRTDHLDDTLRVFGFSLDDADREALDGAIATLDPIPGDCGDEYRRPPYLTAAGDLSDHVENFPPPWEVVESDRGARIDSGTDWEAIGGYSRATRRGRRVFVSGTTATHGDRVVGGRDPASQAQFVLDKIEGALRCFGSRLRDVVRTRIYVADAADTEAVARVHGERFADIRPANTLVEAGPIGDDYLVEIEAEAELPAGVERPVGGA